MSTTEELAQELRRIPHLSDLTDEQAAWLAGQVHEQRLQPGEVLAHEGEPADRMLIVFTGEIHSRRERGAADGRLYIARAGEVRVKTGQGALRTTSSATLPIIKCERPLRPWVFITIKSASISVATITIALASARGAAAAT